MDDVINENVAGGEQETPERMTKEEVVSYINEAMSKHDKLIPSPVPGFVHHMLDIDVRIMKWERLIKAGNSLFVKLPPTDTDLYKLKIEAFTVYEIGSVSLVEYDSTKQDPNSVTIDADMRTVSAEAGGKDLGTKHIRFTMEPIALDDSGKNFLTWQELRVWVGVEQAVLDDDLELARTIVKTAYSKQEKEYRRRKGTNITTHALDIAIDPLTNALTDGKTFKPQDYFSGKPVKVSTGNGGHALLTIYAGDDVDIDAAYSAYGIDDRTRFWLDPLYKLAYEGHTVVTGSDLLKKNGFSNPYRADAQSVIRDALENIAKATSVRVAIDLTNEKRNKRLGNSKIINSISLQPVVSAHIELDTLETEDGEVVRDFVINLLTKNGNVGDALPLAEYARSRGMLTTVSEEDSTFTGMRVDLDQRQMWRYVLRRIQSKTLSGTILFSTMWDVLDVEAPDVSEWEDPAAVRSVDKQLEAARESLSAYREEEPPETLVAEVESLEARRKELTSKRASDTVINRRRAESTRKRRARRVKMLEKMLDQKKGTLFKSWSWHKDADGKVDGIKIVRN